MSESDSMKQVIKCSECRHVVHKLYDGKSCPKCGCNEWDIHLEIKEKFEFNEKLNLRKGPKQKSSPTSKKRYPYELEKGSRRDKQNRRVNFERILDREEDRYNETIQDFTTGETIHKCDEPLSEHKGHGSAKFRPKDKD